MRWRECYFGVHSSRCEATREINTKIKHGWGHKQFAKRIHTLFYFLHDIINPYMTIKRRSHTPTPCPANSVYILPMMSQSIADDVTMQSPDLTIVTRARKKRYLTRQISILFTTIFTNGRVRMSDSASLKCSSFLSGSNVFSHFCSIVINGMNGFGNFTDTAAWLNSYIAHIDVIKWKHIPCYWTFVRKIHRSPMDSPNKGQWRGALKFSLICAWTNGWVNNRNIGGLRRHRAQYDVTVMSCPYYWPSETISHCSDSIPMIIMAFVVPRPLNSISVYIWLIEFIRTYRLADPRRFTHKLPCL